MNSKLDQRKRSFSYNDLKKKRMQRQMKTKRKSPYKTIEPNQSSSKNKDRLNFKTVSRPQSTIQVHSQSKRTNSHSQRYLNQNVLRCKQDDKDYFVQMRQYARQTINYQKDQPALMSQRRTIEPAIQKLRNFNLPQKNQYSQNLDYLKHLKKKLNANTLDQRKSYNQGLNLNRFNFKIKDQDIQKLDDQKGNMQLKTKSSSKQLVKILLEKSKSKKRILRLEQIRDKIKSERSQSKSLQKSTEFSGIIALRDKLQLNRPKRINFNSQSSDYIRKPQFSSSRNENKQKPTLTKSRSKTRIRKFVPLTQEQQKIFVANRISKQSNKTIQQNWQQKPKQQNMNRISSKKKLLSPEKQVFQQWESKQRQVLQKYNVQLIPIQISDGQEDTVKRKNHQEQLIDQQKQTTKKKLANQDAKNKSEKPTILNEKQAKINLLMIDISEIQQKQQQNQDRNKPNQSFLGKSILQMVNTMERKVYNNIERQTTQNFLDLVGLQTNELKRVFSNREKKKRIEIERFKRIFPEDFFRK